MPAAELRGLVDTYSTAVKATRRQALTVATRAWTALDDYRDGSIADFARTIAPMVEGAQQRVANLTAAYLTAYERIVRGVDVAPVGVPRAEITDLRSVPVLEEYLRPGHTVWTALSEGVDPATAIRRGLDRALSLVSTDLQLAKTHAARSLLGGRDDVAGFRRVLTGSHSCGLCIVASTQRYRRSDLMPIHPGCDCSVAPIYSDADPGQIIDPDRLGGVHDAIRERFGASDSGARNPIDYRDVLVVHEHGDIGPVLGVRGHATTPPPNPPRKRRPGGSVPGPAPTTPRSDRIVDQFLPITDRRAARELRPVLDDLSNLHRVAPDPNGRPVQLLTGTPPRPGEGGWFTWDAVGDPEIRVNWTGNGDEIVSLLHEVGHYVDWRGVTGLGRDDLYSARALRSPIGRNGPVDPDIAGTAMHDLMAGIQRSQAYQTLTSQAVKRATPAGWVDYAKDPVELWARAYSQWAAERLGGEALQSMDVLRSITRGTGYQWDDSDFVSIAPLVEAVLHERGLLP